MLIDEIDQVTVRRDVRGLVERTVLARRHAALEFLRARDEHAVQGLSLALFKSTFLCSLQNRARSRVSSISRMLARQALQKALVNQLSQPVISPVPRCAAFRAS